MAVVILGGFWVLMEIYGPALRGPFLFDDLYLPFAHPGLQEAPLRQWIGQIRPVLMFTYWLNYRLAGMEPYPYHFFSVAAHFLAGIFVWLLARKLLESAGLEPVRRSCLAAFVALLFLWHPLQTESVAYIAGRSEVLSGLFFFAALAVFALRAGPVISWPRALAVLALYGAAALSKEHAASLVAVLVLTDLYWNGGWQGVRRNWRLYVPIVAAAAAAARFVWGVLATSDTAGFGVREFAWYQYFFTQCRALWLYFRLFLLPYGQNLDYDFPISRTPWEHGAFLGLLGLAALVAFVIAGRRRYRLASYGLACALVTLAPTSSVVPILDPVAERRLYLVLPWLALVPVEALSRWRASTPKLAAALAVWLAALGVATWKRNHVWSDAIALWQDTVAKSPHKQRPRFQLAYAYYQEGRCREALAEFEHAARLGPADYRLLLDWGLAADCAGRLEEALEKLRAAAKLEKTAHVHALIGMVLGKSGRREEALEELELAARLDPGFAMTYFYRGNVYLSAGRRQAAIAEYRRALELDPRNEAARQALERALAGLRSP
ncbi:MAG: tetratricopeptide repeat protein [Bryobacterales bacterium]|nr:tetratricopeptide repeat protein [Bryobacteraceae bacterium]MDW8130052.1 tetratricopeptide repeat protein [Bryobacterales bacterium]